MPDGEFIPTINAIDGNQAIVVTEDLEPDGEAPVAIIHGIILSRESAVELRDWLDAFLLEHHEGVARPEDGLTIQAAAREVGVHWQTIRNWIKSGELPATRFGPSGMIVRIAREDLARVRRPA